MIKYTLTTTPSYLIDKFNKVIDQATKDEHFELHGFRFSLQRRGDVYINMDGDVFFCNIIADINANKEGGLFTTEFSGVIDLSIAINYNIDSHRLSTKTHLVSHKWVEQPKIEIGSLSLPIEQVLEMLMQHQESIITAKIDHLLMASVDIKSMIDDAKSYLIRHVPHLLLDGLYLNMDVLQVAFKSPAYVSNKIHVEGAVQPKVWVAPQSLSHFVHTPSIERTDYVDDHNVTFIDIEIPYKALYAKALSYINSQDIGGKPVNADKVEVSQYGTNIKATVSLQSPIKAQLTLETEPSFNESDGTLHLLHPDIKMDTDSFIYKLSAPLVSRFVAHKIEEFTPVSLQSMFDQVIKDTLTKNLQSNEIIKVAYNKVQIEKLRFDANGLHTRLRAEDIKVDISLV